MTGRNQIVEIIALSFESIECITLNEDSRKALDVFKKMNLRGISK
jgi:hypothetical protein